MIPPTCKLKLKMPFYFIFCKFYVAARGFEKRTISILRIQATTPIRNCLYYTPVGSLRCKHLRKANVRETDTPQPLIWYKPYVKRGTNLPYTCKVGLGRFIGTLPQC